MRSLQGFSIWKAGLHARPVDLCGICLRRIRPDVSGHRRRNGTDFQRRLRRPKASLSAPGDAHGIRKTTPPRRRWRPINISPTLSWNAPASRRLAADISSCMTGTARIARRVMNAAMRWTILRRWALPPLPSRSRDRAAISRRAIHGEAALLGYLDEVARYYDSVLIQPIVSGIEYRIFLLDDEVVYCAQKAAALSCRRWRQHDPRTAGET